MNTQATYHCDDERKDLYRNMTPETLRLMIVDTLSAIYRLAVTAQEKAKHCNEKTYADTIALRNVAQQNAPTHTKIFAATMNAYFASVDESVSAPETNAVRAVLWKILTANHILRELVTILAAAE